MKHKGMVELMGKTVIVSKVLRRKILSLGPSKHWVSEECKPWVGWIVGFTWKQTGKRCGGYAYDDPFYFIETGPRTPCMLVTSWPTKKPDFVPLDGFELGDDLEMPDFGSWKNEYGERVRKELSEESKDWPRDDKGRWTKR